MPMVWRWATAATHRCRVSSPGAPGTRCTPSGFGRGRDAPIRLSSIRRAATFRSRGNSSVGRAQPCQGWGRGFESRFPLSGRERTGRAECLSRFVFLGVGSCNAPCTLRDDEVVRPSAGMAKVGDARDLKSCGGNPVRVRFPVPALYGAAKSYGVEARVASFTANQRLRAGCASDNSTVGGALGSALVSNLHAFTC